VAAHPLAPHWLQSEIDANELFAGLWSTNTSRLATGHLSVAGMSVEDIANQCGTPVYVVDEEHARAAARIVRKAFDAAMESVGTTAKVYYAGKSFLCTEVVRWVSEAGLNIDIASG
jgi:diaminopimelate decarboxylase